MSDNTPTQRFDAQPPATPAQRASRLPLILGIIGGVLLIAVIILLVLLLGRGSGGPTASGTDSPTPSDSSATSSTPVPVPTVTVTVTPIPTGGGGGSTPQKPNGNNVLITEYTITPSTISCSAGQTQLHITWKSVNGTQAYFGVNTVDAQAGGMGWDLPTSGTDHDFGKFGSYPYKVSCGSGSPNSYTITVVGNGSRQSLTIPVKEKN